MHALAGQAVAAGRHQQVELPGAIGDVTVKYNYYTLYSEY